MLTAGLNVYEDGGWVIKWIHRVILLVWKIKKVPGDWQKANLLLLYKGKGDMNIYIIVGGGSVSFQLSESCSHT